MDVRTAVAADLPALSSALADAFADDPLWTWMIPERRRHTRLRRVFGALLEHSIPRGNVTTTLDRQAVAVWSAPGEWKLPLPAVLRSAPHMVRGAGLRLPRLLGRLGEVERAHEQLPPGHWYLEMIGTSDRARGQGHGTALMAEAFARWGGLPVYLESSNERNLSFYRRHGFEVTGDLAVRSGPPQWTLWRD
ncbi:GNAT family N-acetyltransferase [Kineosporia succinea]|uniref:Ribosomal protein S18 acetylase RimI-like enzyme n=1 Tax=Kineosporia succinea TaxID=84632 RepID=A0ABT9P5Y2_9ACTN|nr:GNAT family N-acetyltransferase [Kineosporia succinea]MDP9828103.1 ribosomal protein S18 acetylase RimI-like enzyme [Kineosporia succinea]